MNNININFINFPQKYIATLKTVISITLIEEKIDICTLNCIIISDKNMIRLNEQYKQKKAITDIISFLLIPKLFIGEIYIAKKYSQEQARTYNNTWKAELAYLIIHGILHLCGYTDYTKTEKHKMIVKQDLLFNLIERKFF
ncbi:MAG: rRNA maturation RNase YbeY [Endomicrobium sp.]|jgi:probable rRNA maturation factor|nr:rRNA maturation RNase YbeY [Endomicrobium sp.]